MSDTVTVNIETPRGEMLENSEVPNEYTVQELVDELVDRLELPNTAGDGQTIEYSLYLVNKKLNLSPGHTISETKMENGDVIRLVSSQKIPATDALKTIMASQHSAQTDEISVILSVLDVNRHETINLSATRKVGEIIRQIVQNYELPPRDKLGQLIKYKLQSKALGRFLEEQTTLREAHIPTLDRLTLHREEIAGAQL